MEMLSQKITPCLWFDGQAEEAMRFYTSVFADSAAGELTYYGDAGPGKKGDVLTARFNLSGQQFIALNGGPMFKPTPAISFFVKCETQEEIDYYWQKLLQGGEEQQCGWLTDRFGISWQIVPAKLGELLDDSDPVRVNRVMQAMFEMVKLDLAALEKAYSGV